ncbi:MAG: hypothetical protein ACM65L_20880 [Microcoleus sp.]
MIQESPRLKAGECQETNRGKSNLQWEKAKHATRDAWDRVERAIPGHR